jgi:circadian clock protein KaiC
LGGLPRGRPTLVCGSAGCGKTLLGVEYLVRGVVEYDEPGVFVSFEEVEDEIASNVTSLGYDLNALIEAGKLAIEHIHIERTEIQETGEYNLDGLFIRLGLAIDAVGAKRIVLDTIESLFSGLQNAAILRAELRRLFRWLKDRGVTAIITGERGNGELTRQGLEEYVSDCVILLDQRIVDQVSTRRLRIVKYRGSSHGTNEFPFLIDEGGLSVVPITSLGLLHEASSDRISSGIEDLDAMLGGEGYYRGSSVLVSGTAGTGKSSLCAHFADACCARGEKCLYFAFEESESQILRNTASIGIDLKRWIVRGLLRFVAMRPTAHGLETHLGLMYRAVAEHEPRAVVIDPLTNLQGAGTRHETGLMLLRLIDHLKALQVTAMFTSLTHGGSAVELTDSKVSSLMDTWLLLRDVELAGERDRVLYVLKSRGMAHSTQVREFQLTDKGVTLVEAYVGPGGVLTGAARLAQEAREAEDETRLRLEAASRQATIERKSAAVRSQMDTLRADLVAYEAELAQLKAEEGGRRTRVAAVRSALAKKRGSGRTMSGKKRTGAVRGAI